VSPVASAADLIQRKYQADGSGTVQTYQSLRFDKHVRLLREHMGLTAGARVLDIGCGTGALLVELAKAGARVTGMDTFEEAGGVDRDIAEARLRENHVTAPLLTATAGNLPFKDDAFDIGVNIGMLEHLPPDVRPVILREMFRVIRPGGCLFLIAGPTTATPLDQHIPGSMFANWRSREKKIQLSAKAGRRQFLEVPWGISRRELRAALPDASFQNLYAEFFRLDGGQPIGPFRLSPLWLLAWAKRRFHLHRFVGFAAQSLYWLHQEHCHIVAIRKRIAPGGVKVLPNDF
jgi:ubiquinone/menaquinone biosynthesis C-methylase UbiE